MSETVIIANRFHGPPKSGNGGYTCGLAARYIDGVAEVSLRAPPPLDTPLDVVRTANGVALRYNDKDIATARAATLALTPPPAPSRDAAERAAHSFAGHQRHAFPGCFVCGLHHPQGLHIYNGAIGDGLTAAAWTPSADLAAPDGRVAAEFLWAALDCPSYWALPQAGKMPAVLARLTAAIDVRPQIGEPLVIAAWPLDSEGKKHRSASTIYGAGGGVLARAEALWIEVDPERFA